MVVRLWVFVLAAVFVFALLIVFGVSHYMMNIPVNNSIILVEATLPGSFTVIGPYAKAFYSTLRAPLNSTVVAASMVGNPSIRLAWHIDYLTLILSNGSKIIIETKTQVMQVNMNGKWLTITPSSIEPGYVIKAVNGNETLRALMAVANQLLQSMVKNPQPAIIPLSAISRFPFHGISTILPSSLWSQNKSSDNSSAGDPTWALAGFAHVNSSSGFCGYIYPDNGSDLVIPISDYAGTPLTVFQELEYFNIVIGYAAPQVVAVIWPPALVENVWIDNGTRLMELSAGNYLLTSPLNWLATGATLCITQSNPSDSNYAITLTAIVNGKTYNIVTIHENYLDEYRYEVSVSMSSGVEGFTKSSIVYANPVLDSTSAAPYSSSIMIYPSIAFETNDTSSSFFSNNSRFALLLQLGNEPSSVGSWPLFYSISNDTSLCSDIWGTAGAGLMWPPNSGDGLWGASGGTTELIYEHVVSYNAAVGSISQVKKSGLTNTIGVECRYIDTNLSALNMKTIS